MRTGDYRLQFRAAADEVIIERVGNRDGYDEDWRGQAVIVLQRIVVAGQPFVLLSESEYERLCARAGETVPPFQNFLAQAGWPRYFAAKQRSRALPPDEPKFTSSEGSPRVKSPARRSCV